MNDIQDNLLHKELSAILAPLFQHGTVWFGSHEKHKMPIARLIHRLRFHMQKIIYGGRYLGSFGSHGSCAMSTNPDNVHRHEFGSLSGVLNISQEINTMSQNNSALHSGQNIQAQTEQIIQNSTNADFALADHQPKTIADLHQAFAELCFSYGMLGRNINTERNNEALSNIIDDCKALSNIAGQVAGGAK